MTERKNELGDHSEKSPLENAHRVGLGPEHPWNDTLQFVLFIGFFIIWVVDSFYWKTTGFLPETIPLWVRIIIFGIIFSFAVFLIKYSGNVIFSGDHTGKVIQESVYGIIRHPMYMGALMLYSSFFFLSLSLVSFAYILVSWLIIDRMASYEERELQERLGQKYMAYKLVVGKWLPRRFPKGERF